MRACVAIVCDTLGLMMWGYSASHVCSCLLPDTNACLLLLLFLQAAGYRVCRASLHLGDQDRGSPAEAHDRQPSCHKLSPLLTQWHAHSSWTGLGADPSIPHCVWPLHVLPSCNFGKGSHDVLCSSLFR